MARTSESVADAEAGPAAPARVAPVADAAPVATTAAGDGAALRRGLPRTPGGEPWPPAGTTSAPRVAPRENEATETKRVERSEGVETTAPIPASTAVVTADVSTPLPFQRTVFPGKNAYTRPAPVPEPTRIGPFTKGQWAGVVIVGGLGLLGAAAMAVLFVRWLLSLSGMQDFLQTYPGEYHLPEGAPVGFPGWLGWQHFFNVFLMVLIIRSGLSVRNDKRPTAFWTARGDKKSKISLTLWFHQSLDILWLVNGIVFVVLLFVTGQWMRVIPTSWEVFPNALSAALQYVSLDWPTENGWVNYNSLQQLAYGATIFIAAPLAAITGVRMSGIWPKNATKLNKAYPVEWARALHFPVMLYFVVFIAIHVILVFATGALRNLNHMYAAQGSTDPNAYADNWTGFWFLVASLVVISAAWVAARPMVLAPIAKLFGNVSAR
jgi:thiosulfate reductase cytochrome b subunit